MNSCCNSVTFYHHFFVNIFISFVFYFVFYVDIWRVCLQILITFYISSSVCIDINNCVIILLASMKYLFRYSKFASGYNFFKGCRNMSDTSKFDYVKNFEREDKCLPNSWIVVRVDGKGFNRFSDVHNFDKPNDKRGLSLMTKAAASVMEEFRDISIAYGQSDEYSFIFRKDTTTFNRKVARLMSIVNSLFTSAYVLNWDKYFAYTKLLHPPSFDSRVVVYPSENNIRDYLSWRQVDAHINNLYNTVFWALVLKENYTKQQAQEFLKTTVSSQKHEILFKKFGINYNNEPDMFKKGTTLVRKLIPSEGDRKLRQYIIPLNCDLIGDEFWKEHLEILGLKPLQVYHKPLNIPGFLINKPNTSEDQSYASQPSSMET